MALLLNSYTEYSIVYESARYKFRIFGRKKKNDSPVYINERIIVRSWYKFKKILATVGVKNA